MDKTKKTIKILGIITACLICLCCLGVDAWWIYIYKFGANKIEDNVVYADSIEAADGTKANIFEIQYNSNANKNGLEMLEIKISGLTDTKASSIYSQGLQYVATDSEASIKWNYLDEGSFNVKLIADGINKASKGDYSVLSEARYSAYLNLSTIENNSYNYKKYNEFSASENKAMFQHLDILSGANRYNYASSDNFVSDVGGALNPVSENSYFRIQLTEKNDQDEEVKVPYAFKFRGTRTVDEIKNAEEKPMYQLYGASHSKFLYTCNDTIDIYPLYDIDFFAWRIYQKVKGLPAGTNQFTLIELGDWLDYYSVNTDSTLVEDRLPLDKANKVRTMFTSYYGVKISVSADGANKASDSMFKTIHGSSSFNIAPDGVSNGDYFYGRSVITVGLNAFEKIDTQEGCKLKLKDAFVKQYESCQKTIVLKVVIDKDALAKDKKTFAGFTEKSGLENFTVQECYTLETVGGVITKTEVEL